MNKKIKKVRREDVAELAGVSNAVVTWVMNGTAEKYRIPGDTVEKVKKAAEKLNYRPNIWGRLLNTQKSGLLAFVSSELTDPATLELIKSTGAAARQAGFGLMLFDLAGEEKLDSARKKEFESCFAEAFILHGPSTLFINDCLKKGIFLQRPYCILGEGAMDAKQPSVEVDNFEGGKIAVKYLLKRGFKDIGVVGDLEKYNFTKERRDGCENAAEGKSRVKLRYHFRKEGEEQFDSGRNALNRWFDERELPEAVFCMGDTIALGALSFLNSKGINCPGDISIAGFDGTVLAKYASPPLTSVRQPFGKMGEEVINICASLINGEVIRRKSILLKPELSIGRSTS